MASKIFLYLIGLTVSVLIILAFYNTPNTPTPWSQINIQVSSIPSVRSLPQNYSKPSSHQTRRLALFASSIHSKLRSYIFYTPIVAAAWQRIGYDVIVIFVGDFTNTSNASLSPQLNISRTFLKRLGVQVLDFQCDVAYSIKISQLVRIFAGFLSDTIVNNTDYILTTDSDIIPMNEQDYELLANTNGFIYNAFCCGSYKRRNKTYEMYPMSHICLPKQIWRDIFLESVQRQELLNSNLPPSSTVLLSDKAPFSLDTISLYMRQEFPQVYDSNMTKGDRAWYMDQVYSSMLLNDYCENHSTIKIDKRRKTSLRLDPDLPYQMWELQRLPNYGDAHLIHDEIFDSYRWVQFRNLLFFLFNSSLATQFDFYYKQFILTLRDLPEDH